MKQQHASTNNSPELMKVFYVLGRNPKLSREEILAYLRARHSKFTEILFMENLLVLECFEEIPIQELGGVIHSGKITFEGTEDEFESYLEKTEIVPADKFTFATYGNIESEILKEKFKSMRKKAVQKHGRKRVESQGGEKVENPKADFYIFMHMHKNKVYQGLTNQEYNYNDVKNRDMNKPIRREALAISPRLSKILVNLSEAKQNDTMLDPFCGVGAILSEALIKGINVHGIDKDPEAIKGAETNLKWLKNQYEIKNKYILERNDSKRAPNLKFDCIATETPLGKLVKKKLPAKEAEKVISNFEGIIVPILTRLNKVKKKSAKIAITFPKIRDIKVDSEKIAEKTGLSITMQPLEESRPDQFISREIIVFQ